MDNDVREVLCRSHAIRFGIDNPDEHHDFFAIFCEEMPCRRGCPVYGANIGKEERLT
jgi:hypothetical protein